MGAYFVRLRYSSIYRTCSILSPTELLSPPTKLTSPFARITCTTIDQEPERRDI